MANYDIIILGGGLSGNMMAKRAMSLLPNASIAIIDKGDCVDHSFHLHRPIEELNLPWVKHNFFLGVWDGAMRSNITPKDVNDYAYKVYGKLQPSNICNFNHQQGSEIYPVTKGHLLKALGNQAVNICTEAIHINVLDRVVETKVAGYKYKYLINTISLPIFLKLCGIKTTLPFTAHKFNVHTLSLGYSSGLYQMIYNTSCYDNITRATLIDDTVYVESLKEYTGNDRVMLNDSFGIFPVGEPIKISPGRFDPLPREDRKNLYYHLTNQYNILLLGRYGSWTFKVANNVWDDTKLLCEIINQRENTAKGAMICRP